MDRTLKAFKIKGLRVVDALESTSKNKIRNTELNL